MCNKFSILKNGQFKHLTKNDFKDFKQKALGYFFEINNNILILFIFFVVILLTHKENILRLKSSTETKIKL